MSANIQEIIAIATQAHQGQFRSDGVTPYIEHPKAVAESFPETQIGLRAVAWLHDVLEDTSLTAQALLDSGVSPWVVKAVEALTRGQDELYEEYLYRVKSNHMSRKVKIQDILHNLSDSPSKNQVRKYAFALKYLLKEDEQA